VFLGDKLEGQEFENAVNTAYTMLLSVEPFKSYSNRFNIYRLDMYHDFKCQNLGRQIVCDNVEELASVCHMTK